MVDSDDRHSDDTATPGPSSKRTSKGRGQRARRRNEVQTGDGLKDLVLKLAHYALTLEGNPSRELRRAKVLAAYAREAQMAFDTGWYSVSDSEDLPDGS